MHDCSHWVNHQSGWLEIYSFLRTPRAYGQLSTCGFWLRVGETDPHPEAKPVWRDQFTGAGRLSATPSYFNSKQTYSMLCCVTPRSRGHNAPNGRAYNGYRYTCSIVRFAHYARSERATQSLCMYNLQMLYIVSYLCTIVGVYSCAVDANQCVRALRRVG